MVADEDRFTEERERAKMFMAKSPQKGDIWYVISAKWYRKWSYFIGISDPTISYSNDDDASHPGPIDNSDILEENDLRRGCLESDDYQLVHEKFYEFLKQKYGSKTDYKNLQRKVIGKKTAKGETPSIEVFPLVLKITIKTSNSLESTKMTFSKGITVAEMGRHVKLAFPRLNTDFQFVIYCNDKYEVIPITSTLGHEFQMNQEVFVDQKDGLGQWLLAPKPTRCENGAAASSSSSTSNLNRSSPPSSSLSSMRSSSHSRGYTTVPGLRGLNNLGNTCFMNSAIQSLSNVPPLTKFFRETEWRGQLNISNPLGMEGEIANSYADLIDNLWSDRNSSPFMPRRFKMAVGRFAPQFSGFQQQDAQELMAFLLDGLHEDLNRIQSKPYVEVKDSDGREDEVVAQESWTNYLKRNHSIIVDLFHGQLRSELICPDCKRISVTFDPFCYLSLPLPAEETPVMVTLCNSSGRKPTKYSFRVVPEISYRKFLERLRDVAKLPPDTELILGEHLPHSASPAYRVFPPSGELDNIVERTVHSPVENAYHRGPYNFVAHVIPQRTSDSSVVWVEVVPRTTAPYMVHPLLSIQQRMDSAMKDDVLYADLADQLYDYIPEQKLKDFMYELKRSSSDDSDDEKDENNIEMDEDDGGPLNWDELSSDDKMKIGRKLFQLESRHSSSRHYESRTLRISYNIEIDRSYYEYEEHSSVSETKIQGRGVQLSNCLDLFTKKETLGARDSWYCNKCKKHQMATKKFDLWALPQVLVIHLKRFGSAHRVWRNKLNTKVNYPVTRLNLNKWVKNDRHNHDYNLVSVVNHYGSMGGGHYLANALNSIDGKWYNFDDSSVTKIDKEQVVTQNAYVLVYVRDDTKEGMMDVD